jgi:LmbE family N-acetylglucosaminyl deacetylase
MLELSPAGANLRSVLCVGAHCDDIEIGCAATLLKLRREQPAARFHWLILASNPTRAAEARRSAQSILGDGGGHTIEILEFRNGFFPYDGGAIKERFETLKSRVDPDLIFTHFRHDLHQDHRVVSELSWNTFRNHVILEYEIPKYDGGLGSPNLFVPATRADGARKAELLMQCFASESNKQWFTPDTFLGLMRLRGIECAAPEGLAEAFYSRKLTFGFGRRDSAAG